jgi:phage gpG-like protein
VSVKITSRFEGGEGVSRRVKRGLRGKAFGIVSKAVNRSADREFRAEAWSPPQGGTKKWKPRHPLSEKQGPLLGGVGGSLRRSWIVKPSGKNRVVASSTHPGAAVHRGSARGRAGETETRILPKRFNESGVPLMFFALLAKGIVTNPERLAERGVVVPSRPHLTPNPRLRQEINEGLKGFWING